MRGGVSIEIWDADFGARRKDSQLIPRVRELIVAVQQAYKPFAPIAGSAQPTETLITNVILGTFGCLPACDRNLIDGFKSEGLKCSSLNDRVIERILGFCRDHLPDFRKEQARIKQIGGVRYPLMKLVDMYVWQLGYEKDTKPPRSYHKSAHASWTATIGLLSATRIDARL